jgi:putative peptidoglycan lipid II flippase
MTGKNENLSGMVRHAMRMMVGTLASRVLGLAREMLTAALFGATRQLDSFYVAYTLANLSRQLLAEGALSAAFVPVFSRTLVDEGSESGRDLARQAMAVLLFGSAVVIILGILFAPVFVKIMAPGFESEERALAITLTRMLFPFLLFVSIGALAMGILNSMGCFFVPAIAPALSNTIYIIFLLVTMKNISVWNLAIAVLLGGFFQMLLQWYWCDKMGLTLIPSMPKRDNVQLKTMMSLFLPYAAGLSINQINPVISRMLGSFLQGGSISVLNYADRVLQLPLGIFVIAISQSVLPLLSKQARDDTEGFRDFIRDALRFALFLVAPVAAGLFLVSDEIIHLLFFRGAFSEWAWHATSTALALYGLGLPGMASSTVILRAMYARRMPRAAVTLTFVTVAVNLCASLLLMPMFAYAGLAAATATAFTCASIYGGWALSRDIKENLGLFEPDWLLRLAASVLLMVMSIMCFKFIVPYPIASALIKRIIWIIGAGTVGAFAYMSCSLILRCPEWRWISDALRKK